MTVSEESALGHPAGGPETGDPKGPGTEPEGVDRSAALARGAPGIPANFVWWVLGAALVLALGGLLGEHLFSSAGLNPTATTTPAAVTPRVRPPAVPTPSPQGADSSLSAPLPAFMVLTTLTPHPAPSFTLTDQTGQPISVPQQPPHVVVISFFDSPCDDICPVLAQEIEQADHDLGSQATDVEFLSVNTDPRALAQADEGPTLEHTGLAALSNWHMLTGPFATLNGVWKDYGVSISLDTRTDLEAHNDVLDFVDAQGFLRFRATPFADESSIGSFSLPAASIARWAGGIATYAQQLIGQ